MLPRRTYLHPYNLFAATIAVLYFLTNSVLVYAAESNVWSERQKTLRLAALPSAVTPQFFGALPLSSHLRQSIPTNCSPEISSLLATLPETLGRVEKILLPKTATTRPVVIHIEDVHMNQEAQANIGNAVQLLLQERNVRWVALEGAFGPADVGYFRKNFESDSLKKAADYMFFHNKISGPVYAVLTIPTNPKSQVPNSKQIANSKIQTSINHLGFGAWDLEFPSVIGIDDLTHYRANVDAYRRSVPIAAAVKLKLTRMQKEIADRKKASFNPTLLAFDEKVSRYRRGEAPFGTYVQAVSINDEHLYPQTMCFLRALQAEQTLNFRRVEEERAQLLALCAAKLNKAQMRSLVNQTAAYRAGVLSHRDFYEGLNAFCRSAGINLQRYPAMQAYLRYVVEADDLDSEKLFGELREQETRRYASLAVTGNEKQLVTISKQIYLTVKLTDFALTPEEWEEYESTVHGAQCTAIGINNSTNGELCAVNRAPNMDLSSFESFYREAGIRDGKMGENFLKAVHGELVVLVTGGFHAISIDEKLRDAGCAVIRFAPKITKVDLATGTAYLSAFAQEKTPLEKIFEGKRLFLAPEVLTPPIQTELAAVSGAVEVADRVLPSPQKIDGPSHTKIQVEKKREGADGRVLIPESGQSADFHLEKISEKPGLKISFKQELFWAGILIDIAWVLPLFGFTNPVLFVVVRGVLFVVSVWWFGAHHRERLIYDKKAKKIVPLGPTSGRQRFFFALLGVGFRIGYLATPFLPWYLAILALPLAILLHGGYLLLAKKYGWWLATIANNPVIVQSAREILLSDTTSIQEKLKAIATIEENQASGDLQALREALFKYKNNTDLAPTIIDAMAFIRRTGVLREKALEHDSIIGTVWKAVDELGLDRSKLKLVSISAGNAFELRGQPLTHANELIEKITYLYLRKNLRIRPIVRHHKDGDRIEIFLDVNMGNLTDYQRGLGAREFVTDAQRRYRALTTEELVQLIEEHAAIFLKGIPPDDLEYKEIIQDVYGDGTDAHPGIVNALRYPDVYGDVRFIKVESLEDEHTVQQRLRSANQITLNQLVNLAKHLPIFTHYIFEEQIQRWIFFARAAGSHFITAFLKGLFRGHILSDYMVYISRDTVGPITDAIRVKIAEFSGLISYVDAKGRYHDVKLKSYTALKLGVTQWLRQCYYRQTEVKIGAFTGVVKYRKARAWYDNEGNLHEHLPIYARSSGTGTIIGQLHRVHNPSIPGSVHFEPTGSFVVEGGEPHDIPNEELTRIQLGSIEPDLLLIYLINGIYNQFKSTMILDNLQRQDQLGNAIVPKICLVDEVANGTFDFLVAYALEEGSRLDEAELPPSAALVALRGKGAHRLTENQTQEWQTEERAYNQRRLTGNSIDVEIFIGYPRGNYSSGNFENVRMRPLLPGYPSLEIDSLVRDYGMSEKEAADAVDATTNNADIIPQPYLLDRDRAKGYPIFEDVPIKLETRAVQIANYLKELLIYNGVVRYYEGAYWNVAAKTLLKILQDPGVSNVIKSRVLEVLPEFNFEKTLHSIMPLRSQLPELVEQLETTALNLFVNILSETLTFDDAGNVVSINRLDFLIDRKKFLERLVQAAHTFGRIRMNARRALELLDSTLPHRVAKSLGEAASLVESGKAPVNPQAVGEALNEGLEGAPTKLGVENVSDPMKTVGEAAGQPGVDPVALTEELQAEWLRRGLTEPGTPALPSREIDKEAQERRKVESGA